MNGKNLGYMDNNHQRTLALLNGKVYRNGEFTDLDIYIKDEVITDIVSPNTVLPCDKIVDCTDKLIMPGFIDPHVHINLDLGEFKTSDDYESASTAAAFGGITTFIDFLEPINYNREFEEKLKKKQQEAESSFIDYSFHTTVGNFQDNVNKLVQESMENGIPSIKLFTTYSESNRKCSYEKIKELLENSRITNCLIMAHTENDEIILEANVEDTIEEYESSRPTIAEIKEVVKLSKMAIELEGNLYFVHITCGTSVEFLMKNYKELVGEKIFIESCPQYFNLTKDAYRGDSGALFLLAPPLRPEKEQEKLKLNIAAISTLGTDHAPFTKEEKYRYNSPSKIPKGLGGLEYSFALMYNLFGDDIISKYTINPAKIHKLFPKKGIIQEGSDADIVIFDPKKELTIDSGHSKSDYSPYEGMKIKGCIESTILRGHFIVENHQFTGKKIGNFVYRKYQLLHVYLEYFQ